MNTTTNTLKRTIKSELKCTRCLAVIHIEFGSARMSSKDMEKIMDGMVDVWISHEVECDRKSTGL